MFSAASKTSSQPAVAANYIEDVFSTYLYTGTSQPGNSSPFGYLVNNIDLLTKGGMIWTKARTTSASGTNDHVIVDTLRGTGTWPAYSNSPYYLKTNTTAAQALGSDMIEGVTTTGYYIGGGNTGVDAINTLNVNYCSWTFREQAKFFDVVTYTGNGTARTIAHNLGSVPGMMIVKRTSTAKDWAVYHRSTGNTKYLTLNSTAAAATAVDYWNNTNPTSTVFTVGIDGDVNANGETYVAYLFAHDAGGFGLTGTDNVISCGSFVPDGSGNATVNLGYEPQWVLTRSVDGGNWQIQDSMRGMPVGSQGQRLKPNSSGAEDTTNTTQPNATGFSVTGFGASQTHIYMAIRRGPMKVPTTGTSVFSPNFVNGSTGQVVTTNFAVDSQIWNYTNGTTLNSHVYDRLRGISSTTTESGQGLVTSISDAEVTDGYVRGWNNTGFQVPSGINGAPVIYYNFRRAPGFFDEVCYTGNGSTQTIAHNLTVAPELIIGRNRTGSNWSVNFNFAASTQSYAFLNQTGAGGNDTYANVGVFSSAPTSTNMFLIPSGSMNGSGQGIVAYLFATLAGVSKVGTYTGNGGTQAIACGFTGGARFVLIKRTDAGGGWYVYDTARGMTLLTNPYSLLNTAAAEVATLGSVTTTTGGFTVDATVLAAINTNAASYIFLAIA